MKKKKKKKKKKKNRRRFFNHLLARIVECILEYTYFVLKKDNTHKQKAKETIEKEKQKKEKKQNKTKQKNPKKNRRKKMLLWTVSKDLRKI